MPNELWTAADVIGKKDAEIARLKDELAKQMLADEMLRGLYDDEAADVARLNAELRSMRAGQDALVAAAYEAAARRTFPILGSNGARIDYQLVVDHGGQAKENHYQTVDRLAERGGLSWCELHAVLTNRKYTKIDQNTAIKECRAIEAEYLASIAPTAQDAARVPEIAGQIREITEADMANIVAHLSYECEPTGPLPNANSLMMEVVRLRNKLAALRAIGGDA